MLQALMLRVHAFASDGAEAECDISDQWRIYKEATEVLEKNTTPLRLWVQASAGAGKSFLLESLYLWCLLNGHKPAACAPTGIAAARIRIPRTAVRAYTYHYLFGMGIDLISKFDPSKPNSEDTKRILDRTVLFFDETSMLDDVAGRAGKDV